MDREQVILELQQLKTLARSLNQTLADFSEVESAALADVLPDLAPLFKKFRSTYQHTGELVDRSHQTFIETELRRLLGENHRQGALLDAIFAADPSGLAVVAGPGLRFVYANPAYRYICPNLGKDPIGLPYEQIWPKEDGDGFHTQIQSVLETGRPFQAQRFERIYPDGSKRTFTFQSRRIEWDHELAALLIFWDTTDLTLSQRQLIDLFEQKHHQAEELRGLFNAMHDGVIIYDAQGLVLHANPALIRIFGFDPTGKKREEIAANIIFRWPDGRQISADDLPSVRALRGEAVKDERICLTNAAGRTYVLEKTSSQLYDADQRANGVLVVWHDITERKQFEARLAAEREWLRTTLASIGDAVITTDAEGKVSFLNPVAEQLTGWNTNEAAGQPMERVFPIINEQTRQPAVNPIARVLQDGVIVGLANHTALIDQQGREVPIEDSAAPIRDGSGQTVGVVMVFRDVTEKRKTEQALHESRAVLQAVIDGIPDPIFLKDRDSRLLLANPATLELIGKPSEQVFGKNDGEFYDDPAVGQAIMANDRQVMDSGQTQVIEEHVTKPERPGQGRLYLSTKTPYRNTEGQVIGVIGVARDITERKEKEKELAKLYRTLQALNKSNQVMARAAGMRATDESTLMNEVCQIITEDCGYAMVWLGFAEQDAGKTVRPVAYAGFEAGYLETLKVTWADTERGRGPTGTAIRTGQPSLCRNMLTDPRFAPWREEAVKRGYASSLVLPLIDAERVFGAITVYANEPGAFGEDEVKLLSELANDLSYGITSMRLRLAHARAEKALIESEARYRSLFLGMTEGFALHEIICNEKGIPQDYRFLDLNPAFERLTGLALADVKGKLKSEIAELRDDDPKWIEIYGKVALTGEPVHFENYSSALQRHYEVFAYCPAPLQFAVIFMNITERKQAEEALRQAREVAEQNRTQIEVQHHLIEQREQERQQIARDLHDGPVQTVTGVTFALQNMIVGNVDPQQKKELEGMRASLQEVLGDLRGYAVDLRPPVLFSFGLRRAIQAHLENFQEKHPELHTQLKVDWVGDLLSEQISIALFRVYQESLNNILKHARATEIRVQLVRDEHQIRLMIEDNGAGFAIPEKLVQLAREGHLGLVGMRERMEAIGGSLEIDSQPGKGTKIVVRAPLL